MTPESTTCGPRRVLVAGASGALGQHVARHLMARGHSVTALVNRRPLATDLADGVDILRADALVVDGLAQACRGIDVVFSSLGASIVPDWRLGRRTFATLDVPANLNLLAAAEAAGVRRFVYVAVAGHETFGHHRYVQAHEQVVAALRASAVPSAVVRPPGFFSAFRAVLAMAKRGRVPVVGDGSARTNPIDERDLADVCVETVEGRGHQEVIAGGPEVLTRLEIVELAFQALEKPVRTGRLAPTLMRAAVPLMRLANPRMADLTAFFTDVSTRDLVVPAIGRRRLSDYFTAVLDGRLT